MSKEIELKAHVDNWQSLLEKIRKSPFVKNELYEEKEDIYFFNPLIEQTFRVRKETLKDSTNFISKQTVYTVKEKIMNEGIENNREIEVNLSYENFDSSITFFESLGFKQTMLKNKKGYSFDFVFFEYPLHIELLKVNELGWFFEIEFVVEEDVKTVDQLIKNLYKTLDIFEIPHSAIEKRYYSQMLCE